MFCDARRAREQTRAGRTRSERSGAGNACAHVQLDEIQQLARVAGSLLRRHDELLALLLYSGGQRLLRLLLHRQLVASDRPALKQVSK